MTKNEAKAKIKELKEQRTELREKMSLVVGKMVELEVLAGEYLSRHDEKDEEYQAKVTAKRNAAEALALKKYESEDLNSEIHELDDEISHLQREVKKDPEAVLRDIDEDLDLFEKGSSRVIGLLERLSDDEKHLDRYIGVICKVAGKFGVVMDRVDKETEAQKKRHGVVDTPEVPEGAQEEATEEVTAS